MNLCLPPKSFERMSLATRLKYIFQCGGSSIFYSNFLEKPFFDAEERSTELQFSFGPLLIWGSLPWAGGSKFLIGVDIKFVVFL
jgi:hypothetical protein